MKQQELVSAMAVQMGTTKKAAKEALDAVLNGIEVALSTEGEIKLAGFGKFVVREMAERKGRNPQTREEITIPARNKVAFVPAKAFKELVNKEEV